MGTCQHCGGEISDPETLASHQEHCDVSGKKKIYECANCGDLFKDYPSRRETRGRETFYCSRDCKYDHEKTGETVECAWCSDNIYRENKASASGLDPEGEADT
jgi:predicted RNA-binding Zn-ribbon protein involved in translation (DUF1610 family)